MPRFAFIVYILMSCLSTFAESPYANLTAIEVIGNKKTKTAIILREINFTIGEEIDTNQLKKRISENELRLFNMRLFSKINLSYQFNEITTEKQEPTITIIIALEERYYLFVAPEVSIAGITFNNWWKQEKFSLKYLDAGIKINQKNISGRNDELKISMNSGYTNTIKMAYRLPYIDRQKIYGIQPKIKFYRNRVALVGTQNNQQIFFPDTIPPLLSEIVQSHFEASLAVSRRKDIRITQSLELRYETNTIKDTILQLDNQIPFFLSQQNQLQFLSLKADLECNFTDIQFYPQKGWYHKTTAEKNGLGILDAVNQFKINSTTTYYHSFSNRMSTLFNVKGQLSFPLLQPYYLTNALGTSDNNIRTYEDYVIDGQHYVMFRTAHRYKVAQFKIKNPVKIIKKIESVPLNIYAKSFLELGKVWALPNTPNNPNIPNNNLSNTFLPGFGGGLDITSFYDLVLSIEYGFNKLGEHNIVFHFNFEY